MTANPETIGMINCSHRARSMLEITASTILWLHICNKRRAVQKEFRHKKKPGG
jgi:hypothetical protein